MGAHGSALRGRACLIGRTLTLEQISAVPLLRVGDPNSDSADWSTPQDRRCPRHVLIYVEGRKGRSDLAPCYEVATTAATTVGAVLDAIMPHAHAAWPYTLGGFDEAHRDFPSESSELWLCLRCRPGGALVPLCRRDRIHATLVE